ncbi:MAG: MFS transporter, partial [Melioribacteraceae bacterium]
SVLEILLLSVLLGIINAFDVPSRQSLVQDMVDNKEDLGNAIALNSSMVQVAKLVGPAIAGIVLELFGAGICFLINALSFVAVIISLLMMRLPKYIPQVQTKKVIEGLKEGINYLRADPSIGSIVLLLSLSSFLVIPFVTLLPVVAKMSLHGNASTYGYLFSASGIGGIMGAIFLASLKPEANLRKVLISAIAIFGVGLMLFSQTENLLFALIFATVSGFGMMSLGTITNTILQTSSSKEMRGRIMSYYAMAFFGMQPIGALMIGSVSHYVGTSETILAEGIAALLIAAIFFQKLWKFHPKEQGADN